MTFVVCNMSDTKTEGCVIIENVGCMNRQLGELLQSVGSFGTREYLKDVGTHEGKTKNDDLDPSLHKQTFKNPETFAEAWEHPEPFQRKPWRASIGKEFMKMEHRQV